ncbi:hypothetical protein CLV84_0375 [Neolewinella xylanilytica]|uniref:ABM domain-containing protein n=1 Tax=Neolewinella xylanilytica TaxID=1514080 RepID=A0A2S6I7F1_9BACT|nr:hypothetical protein [Neolewinella xylanilytica]PPK87434.1 hypothetical protein CLV84_0375 [Neolewinella xylanilytica]
MLTVFSEHYLTPDGRLYFPTWTAELHRSLAKFDGFSKLEAVEDLERPERQLLWITFHDMESMLRWSSSCDHRRVMGLMEWKQLRKPYTQLLVPTVHSSRAPAQ